MIGLERVVIRGELFWLKTGVRFMALSDHEGNTHSHLEPERVNEGRGILGADQPDRGHRVGMGVGEEYRRVGRPGEPMLQEKPESTLPKLHYRERDANALNVVRSCMKQDIEILLEHQPMVESQRRILVQALGVLETLA